MRLFHFDLSLLTTFLAAGYGEGDLERPYYTKPDSLSRFDKWSTKQGDCQPARSAARFKLIVINIEKLNKNDK